MVVLMVRVSPAAIVPSRHGNGVVHAPALDTKLRPGGTGSVTVTLCAGVVPILDTTIVNTICSPGCVTAGPVFRMLSTAGAIGVSTVLGGGFSGGGVGPPGGVGGWPVVVALLCT